MEITITNDKTSANWYYVSTVTKQTYDIIEGPQYTVNAQSHTLSPS